MPKLSMIKFKIEEALCDYVKSHGVRILVGNELIDVAEKEMSRIVCRLNGYYVGAKDYCVNVKMKLCSKTLDLDTECQGTFCAFISQNDNLPKITDPYDAASDIIVSKRVVPMQRRLFAALSFGF